MSRGLDIEILQHQLNTKFFGMGNRLMYSPVVASTNTLAMQLARNGSEEGMIVLSDSQTAGKGRQGRRWVDLYGCNVLLSTILRPLFPPYLLVMIASLAVVEAIARTCNVSAMIKWPNDLLIGDRKVAGILIETSHDHLGRMVAIMGIGVNVNGHVAQIASSELERTDMDLIVKATTLETVCGHVVSREIFIANLLQHLEANYLVLQQEMQDPVAMACSAASRLMREDWRRQLSTLGRTIEVHQGTRILGGIAEDVNDTGELLLRCHSGEQISITWGDIGYPTE